ncbi:MAG TPA: hypothetical protein VNI83_02450 [Vicinamibacterales bacterium]|nr:hypothetical protein [Vicinamibacterales bacterium]
MMRNRPLYVRALALGGLFLATGSPAAADSPPCAACIRLAVPEEQFARLPAPRRAGTAVEVALETTAGSEAAVRGAAAVVVIPGTAPAEPAAMLYALRATASRLRAIGPSGAVSLFVPPELVPTVVRSSVPAYFDELVAADPAVAAALRRAGAPVVWLATRPGASIAEALDLSRTPGIEGVLLRAGTGRDPEPLADALLALRARLPRGLVPAAGGPSTRTPGLPAVTVECRPVRCEPEAFYDVEAHETAMLIDPPGPIEQLVVAPAGSTIELHVLVQGVRLERVDPERGSAPGVWLVPGVRERLVIRARPPASVEAPAPVVEAVDVRGRRELTVEEIIARHQAAAARQRRLVQAVVLHGRTRVGFELPGLAAPVTIEAETEVYQREGLLELVQREVRVNGVAAGRDLPRLPIIEPDRAAAAPLALALTEHYRYRLDGVETWRGRRAYVVAFDPAIGGESLFRGRAWIDAEAFVLLRSAAVQTGLRGPIVASEQIDEYVPVSAGGEVVWLIGRSELRQRYEGAGHTTPVSRLLAIDRHEVNPPDFEVRRLRAHASDAIVLRDTPDGLRYLERAGEPGERRERRRGSRVQSLVAGVLIDPNITRPLPFAGLAYTDFAFLGGGQLHAVFGGTWAQAAWTQPGVGGPRWQLGAQVFATLAEYNDRWFEGGRERYERNLRQRPARLSVGARVGVGARSGLRVDYTLEYTRLRAADSTAPWFRVPADQLAHGVRLSADTLRCGWTLQAWWHPAWRSGWREWGAEGDYRPGHRHFVRYGVSATRPWLWGPRAVARLEASAMGGDRLDRFSRFGTGALEERLRGYPSASLRFDRGAIARGAVAWLAAPRLRLDGLVEFGLLRDTTMGSRPRGYPALGAALEAPVAPGWLAELEWSYGVRGIDGRGRTGTHVLRVTAIRAF